MVPPQLCPGFSLREAAPAEIETLFTILELACANDPLLTWAWGKCPPKLVHTWIMEKLSTRWLAPDVTSYVITEDSTG
jgi:hypothetical protein